MQRGNTLNIVLTHATPGYFVHMRGSSPFVEYDGMYWAVTHNVLYSKPRNYFHTLVALDKNSLKPAKMSLPFVFRENGIEYCLSLVMKDGYATFVFSIKDSNPGVISVPIKEFTFIDLL